VDAHVPGLPEPWRAVTVAQLLNHTSGVPSYTDAGPRWERRWGEVLTPDSLVALTAAEPMAFAPGTRWRYSNTGYVLLGMLLERAHGRTWAQVVEERVTRALDLPTVRPCDARAVVPHRARGYDPAPDPAAPTARAGVLPAPYLDMSHPYAAGALCASAMDLARWGDALMRGRVVTPASFARMTTAEGAARPWRYGYGLMLDSLGDRALVLHGGDIPGFTAATALVPAAGVSIAVLASRGNVDAEGLARDVARAVLGMPAEVPPTPVALPADDRRRAAGHYVLDTPGQPMPFALVEAGDALALQPAGGPALPLVFHGRRRLPAGGGHALVFGAGFDARFRLEVAVRQGRVVGGRVAQGGGVFEVRRVAPASGR
jgi:CubicO group peptidase (beta-lactamase class C family)